MCCSSPPPLIGENRGHSLLGLGDDHFPIAHTYHLAAAAKSSTASGISPTLDVLLKVAVFNLAVYTPNNPHFSAVCQLGLPHVSHVAPLHPLLRCAIAGFHRTSFRGE